MSYTPRLTAPDPADLRQIQTASGGYNQCIYGSDGPPSVLPNCTGYVHFRLMEIRNVNTDNSGLPFTDAYTYWNGSTPDWVQEQDPSLGAVLCYTTVGGPNPGHVCIVEQIIDNDTIVVSESNYGGNIFDTLTCYRANGWRPTAGWNVTPQGFLKNPYVTLTIPSNKLLLLLAMKKRKEKENGFVVTRTI